MKVLARVAHPLNMNDLRARRFNHLPQMDLASLISTSDYTQNIEIKISSSFFLMGHFTLLQGLLGKALQYVLCIRKKSSQGKMKRMMKDTDSMCQINTKFLLYITHTSSGINESLPLCL